MNELHRTNRYVKWHKWEVWPLHRSCRYFRACCSQDLLWRSHWRQHWLKTRREAWICKCCCHKCNHLCTIHVEVLSTGVGGEDTLQSTGAYTMILETCDCCSCISALEPFRGLFFYGLSTAIAFLLALHLRFATGIPSTLPPRTQSPPSYFPPLPPTSSESKSSWTQRS